MPIVIKKGVPAPTSRIVKSGKMSGAGNGKSIKTMPMMKSMPKKC